MDLKIFRKLIASKWTSELELSQWKDIVVFVQGEFQKLNSGETMSVLENADAAMQFPLKLCSSLDKRKILDYLGQLMMLFYPRF